MIQLTKEETQVTLDGDKNYTLKDCGDKLQSIGWSFHLFWFVPLYVIVVVARLFSGYGYEVDELPLEMNYLMKEDDEFIVIDDCLCVSEESYKGWKYLLLLESIVIALIMFILVIVGTIYVGIKWFVLFLLLGCASSMVM